MVNSESVTGNIHLVMFAWTVSRSDMQWLSLLLIMHRRHLKRNNHDWWAVNLSPGSIGGIKIAWVVMIIWDRSQHNLSFWGRKHSSADFTDDISPESLLGSYLWPCVVGASLFWLILTTCGQWWEAAFHNDDVIKLKHFPRYWPFVRGIHRSPVNSPHKGQWRGASMFSLICVWKKNGWVNNREAGDLKRYRAHYDVTVMPCRMCLQNEPW